MKLLLRIWALVLSFCFASHAVATLVPIPRINWTIQYVDSEELTAGEWGAATPATNAIDGDTNTIWHTEWASNQPGFPHEIQLNLGAPYSIAGFRHLPRQDGILNGRIQGYEFFISADGTNWGTATASGTFSNSVDETEITFPPVIGQYVCLRSLSEYGPAGSATSLAEINVLTPDAPPAAVITSPSSNLTISVGDTIDFAASAEDPDSNTPLTYQWSFGNRSGIPGSTELNPGTKHFNVAGTFLVTFTATDAFGLTNTTPAMRTIVVQPPAGPLVVIPQTNWSLRYVDSEELISGEWGPATPATNVFDGDTNTFWHTEWFNTQPNFPHEVQINLGGIFKVAGFRILPRQDGQLNGRINQFEFYLSTDGTNWGTAKIIGNFENTNSETEVLFASETAQYVRLRTLSEYGPAHFATSLAELNIVAVSGIEASVTLTDLSHVYDGSGKSATVETYPAGLAVDLTYNGDSVPPTNAGLYEVIGTVIDSNYSGSATNTLVISPAPAIVTLTNLTHIFNGNGQSATAETQPAGLNVQLTYNGDSVQPTNAGLYEVIGTVIDPNYSGSATNTLTINPAALTVTANDETKFFGQVDPAFTATYSGFVGTDDPSLLNGTLTFTREPGEAVGLYAIAPSGLSATNYQVTFNPGTLTISPIPAPVILGLTNAGSDQFLITWSSVSNVMYQVLYRSDLASGDWIPLTNVTATNETAFAIDNTGGAPQRFYQVIIPTP